MENILGPNNSILDYLLVVGIYLLMFLLIRFSRPAIELNFKNTYRFLVILWFVLMFTGNYFFYLLGVMSFLPWLNNLLHSSLWVGLCLAWLYYVARSRPMWEQFIHFSFASFIIKMGEHLLLGSWSRDSYFGIEHPLAYLVAMSLVDGFYPIISSWVLVWLARSRRFGIYIG